MRKRKALANVGEKRQVFGSPCKRMRFEEGPHATEESPHQSFEDENHPEREQPSNVEAHLRRPIFLLDLFCGTAGVAAAFRSVGGEALGIDHMVDKRRVKGPVAKVDLAQRDGQATVLSWIYEDKVDAVMIEKRHATSTMEIRRMA